jgi:hypothetical protein
MEESTLRQLLEELVRLQEIASANNNPGGAVQVPPPEADILVAAAQANNPLILEQQGIRLEATGEETSQVHPPQQQQQQQLLQQVQHVHPLNAASTNAIANPFNALAVAAQPNGAINNPLFNVPNETESSLSTATATTSNMSSPVGQAVFSEQHLLAILNHFLQSQNLTAAVAATAPHVASVAAAPSMHPHINPSHTNANANANASIEYNQQQALVQQIQLMLLQRQLEASIQNSIVTGVPGAPVGYVSESNTNASTPAAVNQSFFPLPPNPWLAQLQQTPIHIGHSNAISNASSSGITNNSNPNNNAQLVLLLGVASSLQTANNPLLSLAFPPGTNPFGFATQDRSTGASPALEGDSKQAAKVRAQSGPEPFPEKLYRLLHEIEDMGKGHIISFAPTGKSFRIHHPDEFIAEIAPLYFKHKNIGSFKRQLHFYHFAKLSTGQEEGCYFHPDFQRGRPDLLPQVRRLVRLHAPSSQDDDSSQKMSPSSKRRSSK